MADSPRVPSLDTTYGAMFLGCIISVFLYGMSFVQLCYYYLHYRDGRWLKLFVATVFICDTIPTALIIHSVYRYLITNFNNLGALAELNMSVKLEPIFAIITAVLVQSYYALRVLKFSRNRLLFAVILFLTLSYLSVCIVGFVNVIPKTRSDQLPGLITITTTVADGIQVAVDLLIAASLCVLLNRSRTGLKQTDNMINKFIVFFVNTGLLTGIDAILASATASALPHTLIYFAFYFPIGRLYVNSLLATLNCRDIISATSACIDLGMPSWIARTSTTQPVVCSVAHPDETFDDRKVQEGQAQGVEAAA